MCSDGATGEVHTFPKFVSLLVKQPIDLECSENISSIELVAQKMKNVHLFLLLGFSKRNLNSSSGLL